jgi:hypothetical protein
MGCTCILISKGFGLALQRFELPALFGDRRG